MSVYMGTAPCGLDSVIEIAEAVLLKLHCTAAFTWARYHGLSLASTRDNVFTRVVLEANRDEN